jgi:hypothetical protein
MRAGLIASAVVLLVAACTASEVPPEPAPTPPPTATEPSGPSGINVAVVLPPREGPAAPERAAEVEAQLESLVEELGPELRAVRVDAPADADTASDLTAVSTDRGTDLVCVLGTGGRDRVLPELALHPDLRFCVAPVATDVEVPDAVLAFELPVEELGRLIGAGVAEVGGDAPVGFVGGGEALPSGALRDGVVAAIGERELVEASGEPTEAVAEVLEAGASVIVLDPRGDATAAATAAAASVPIAVPAELVASAGAQAAAVLTWSVRWEVVVDAAIRAQLAADGPTSARLELADGVVEIASGDAATASAAAALEAAWDRLTSAGGGDDGADPSSQATP